MAEAWVTSVMPLPVSLTVTLPSWVEALEPLLLPVCEGKPAPPDEMPPPPEEASAGAVAVNAAASTTNTASAKGSRAGA
jgi:hypothetical protein